MNKFVMRMLPAIVAIIFIGCAEVHETKYANGQVESIIRFNSSGSLDGEYIYYYDNGVVKKQGTYADGLRVGTWLEYNKDSTLVRSLIYENGKDLSFVGKWVTGSNDTIEYRKDMTFRKLAHSPREEYTGHYDIVIWDGGRYVLQFKDGEKITSEYQIHNILKNEYTLYNLNSGPFSSGPVVGKRL